MDIERRQVGFFVVCLSVYVSVHYLFIVCFSIKLYYNTGDFVMLRLPRGADQSDIQEMVKRLAAVSSGVEVRENTLQIFISIYLIYFMYLINLFVCFILIIFFFIK